VRPRAANSGSSRRHSVLSRCTPKVHLPGDAAKKRPIKTASSLGYPIEWQQPKPALQKREPVHTLFAVDLQGTFKLRHFLSRCRGVELSRRPDGGRLNNGQWPRAFARSDRGPGHSLDVRETGTLLASELLARTPPALGFASIRIDFIRGEEEG